MDLDAYFSEHPDMADDAMDAPEGFRSGFVALVGRPNAGKSTLMNALVGQKVAITSATPQTTRRNVQGVLTLPTCQMVFVDTPGLHKPHDLLGEHLNASASSALHDEWVAAQVAKSDAARVLVLSKRDIATDAQTASQFEAARNLVEWDAVVSLSAKTGYNAKAFIEEVMGFLPEGPLWYPRDATSNVGLETMISEIVREKVLRSFREEVPHSVGVKVDSLEERAGLFVAEASIYVERASQKAMLIGAKGASVKRIGMEARADLEDMLKARWHLGLHVKVKKNWRKDETEIQRLGYTE